MSGESGGDIVNNNPAPTATPDQFEKTPTPTPKIEKAVEVVPFSFLNCENINSFSDEQIRIHEDEYDSKFLEKKVECDEEVAKKNEQEELFNKQIEKLTANPVLRNKCSDKSIIQGAKFNLNECIEFTEANKGDTHILNIKGGDFEDKYFDKNQKIMAYAIFHKPGKNNIEVEVLNQNGNSAKTALVLNVSNVNPKLNGILESYSVEKGEETEFIFLYEDPGEQDKHEARIKWSSSSQWINLTNVKNGKITVSKKFNEGGQYSAVLEIKDNNEPGWNIGNSDSKSFNVISSECSANEKPGKPGTPHIERRGNESNREIRVSWAASKCLDKAYGYTVKEINNNLNSDQNNLPTLTGIEDNYVTYRNLKPGQRYIFEIIGFNKNGSSPISSSFYWDEPKIPVYPPTNLVVSNNLKDKLVLNWSHNKESCFYVYRDGVKQNNQSYICKNEFTDNNVKVGSNYSYQISAYNLENKEESDRSEVVSQIATGLPGIPLVNLSYENDKNIKINISILNKGGIDSVSFDIYRNNQLIRQGLLDNNYIDNNLGDGGEYSYEVLSVNRHGKSSKSSIQKIIHIGKPGKPQLNITSLKGKLILEWNLVENGGSELSYEIWEDSNQDRLIKILPSYTNTFTITEQEYGSKLSASKNYSFYIKAVNASSLENTSSIVSANPLEEITKFDPPTSFLIQEHLDSNECGSDNTKSGVKVRWEPNSEANNFKVNITPNPNTNIWPKTVSRTDIPLDICGLKNGSIYEISIIAVNNSSPGFNSNPLIGSLNPGMLPTWGPNPISLSNDIRPNGDKWLGINISNLIDYGMAVNSKEIKVYKSGNLVTDLPDELGADQTFWSFDPECGVDYTVQARARVSWTSGLNEGWGEWSPISSSLKIDCPAQMPLDPPLLKSNVVITPSTFKIGDTINIRFETDKLIAPENIGWRLLYKTPSNQTPNLFVDGDFLPDCSGSTCIWNGPFIFPNLSLH